MPIDIQVCSSATEWYEEWRQLWTRENGDPFLHPAWSVSFEQSRDDEAFAPYVIGARLEGNLVGVLPMRRDGDRVLRFLTSGPSDYEDALVADDLAEHVVARFAEVLCQQSFELLQMPEGSLLARELRNRGLVARPSAPCPGIRLTEETFRDVTSRKSLRRHENKLSRLGTVRLEPVGPGDIELSLDQLFEQHIARRLLAGDKSQFLDARGKGFYRKMVSHRDFGDFGAFHVLKAGDRNAAYHVGLKNRSVFIWYKPTFDMNLESEGPGEVLLKALVEHASASGVCYFDFSRGKEAFKLRFANEQRTNQAFAHRLPVRRLMSNAGTRISRGVARRMNAWASRLVPRKPPRPSRQSPIETPTACPEPPQGCEVLLGKPDLVMFGVLSTLIPEYVTPERMRLAVSRRRRGDSLLLIRQQTDGSPLCCAWLRYPASASAPGGSPTGPGRSSEPAVIFDCWRRTSATAGNLEDFSIRYLAWVAAQRGMSTVFSPDTDLQEAAAAERD